MTTCTRRGDANLNICGWWFLRFTEQLCPVCSAIVRSDDTDHGDEHVETAEESERLHACGVRHRARECRRCLGRAIPSRPDVSWIGPDRECRSVLEPPVDDHVATPQPTGWQAHVAAHPREEFLATFREAHAALHRLWTAAVGTEGYDKAAWKVLDNALARFARDAGEEAGVGRTEPLL